MNKSDHTRAQQPLAKGSARAMLFELQVEQHHHDEKYHREIARLPIHQRLNHMALHFAKYAGKIAAAVEENEISATCVDILIIALSTSNVLNGELWELLEAGEHEYPGLIAFGLALAQRNDVSVADHNSLLRATVIASGRVAAACEKIDHLEPIAFRTEISVGVGRLGTLALAMLGGRGVDPGNAVRERLAHVKERLKLHGRI
jgi:hypothetical protein